MSGTGKAVRWQLQGFLEHFRFVHKTMPDHAYAWVLGAGASKPSGIPLAGELVKSWLGELQRRLDPQKRPLAEWATAENLGIDKFTYDQAASFYSRVYERRFGDNPDEGFAYLEDLMGGKDPSPGYSILAQILEKTPHKVVISTNFDNLVADALSIYTSTFPLVIGHESLANFVKIVSRRPVICKIHRDLLLGPKNDTRSLRRLHESWAAALRALFSQYTPLFVGYGGNDDSLMDLLESLDPGDIKGQLIWCYYERSEPTDRIRDLVAQHRGALVPVPDFDMLMVLLGSKLDIEPIDDTIEKRATERAHRYRKQLIDLDTTAHPEVRRLLKGAFERAGGSLALLAKARSEISTDRREQLFRQALETYPDSSELQDEFAAFLWLHGRDYATARALMEKTRRYDGILRIDVESGDLDAAEKALGKLTANTPDYHSMVGILRDAQGDLDAAEAAHIAAANSNQTNKLVNLGGFYVDHGREDDALNLVRGLYGAYPLNAEVVCLYARLRWTAMNDTEGAGTLFGKLLEMDDTQSRELLVAAIFFLAQNARDNFTRSLDRIASKPMPSWRVESTFLFLRIIDAVMFKGDDAAYIDLLRKQFTHHYSKSSYLLQLLTKLLESSSLRVPSSHRKLLLALANAISDPARRSNLNVFPQWRPTTEPAPAKS